MQLHLISQPDLIEQEAELLTSLLVEEVGLFHLRKPQVDTAQVEGLLKAIPEKYHSRIILHYHFELLDKFRLGGLHFNRKNLELWPEYIEFARVKGYSAHSIEEFNKLPIGMDYCFLSPVFDSVSKPAYTSAFDVGKLSHDLKNRSFSVKVIALGGVVPERLAELKSFGFQGAALLGYLWQGMDRLNSLDAKTNELSRRCRILKAYE